MKLGHFEISAAKSPNWITVIKEHEIVKISKKKGTFSVARFWVKSQVGENEALSLVEGLEKIFMKLSIEEKMKQTKITEMLAINKQSDENITVEII